MIITALCLEILLILVKRKHVDIFHRCGKIKSYVHLDHRLVPPGLLCGNQDHSVRTCRTVDCGSRSILQYFHARDILRIYTHHGIDLLI